MVLVVLKYYIMDNGEQSVIMDGIKEMLELYVVNLVIKMLLELFRGTRFLQVQDKYG